MSDPFVRFPTSIAAGGTDGRLIYERVRDHFAVKGDAPQPPSGRMVVRIEDETPLSIHEGDAARAATQPARGVMLPVYRLIPNGPLSVPTGSIFARFRDGTAAADQAEDLDAAGYRITVAPAYAPNAAWLEAKSGDMADALARIGELSRLPGLVRIEPQMLSPAARKDG